jgi:hypothetical protein
MNHGFFFRIKSPAIIGDVPPKPVVWALRYGLAPFFPRWTPFFMPHPVSAERIWKELEPREYHANDPSPLNKGGEPFCLGTALGLLTATECVRNDVIPGITVPFTINHGDEDASVPIEGKYEPCVPLPRYNMYRSIPAADFGAPL